jgi:hypothetical protein
VPWPSAIKETPYLLHHDPGVSLDRAIGGPTDVGREDDVFQLQQGARRRDWMGSVDIESGSSQVARPKVLN